MGLLLQVNQPDDLVFVQRQQDRLGVPGSVGAECIDLWCAADPTTSWRSWYEQPPVFSVYTGYTPFGRRNQYRFSKSLHDRMGNHGVSENTKWMLVLEILYRLLNTL